MITNQHRNRKVFANGATGRLLHVKSIPSSMTRRTTVAIIEFHYWDVQAIPVHQVTLAPEGSS